MGAGGCEGKMKIKLKNQRGTAIVEFAVVLVLVFLLFFGIVEFALMLFEKAVITNASREGARAGIVSRPPEEELTPDEIRAIVKNYCLPYKINIRDEDINIPPISRDPVTNWRERVVDVQYQYEFIALPAFMTIPIGPIILRAYTVMKMENNT